MTKTRQPFLAAIASFFVPGLGQWYCGHWRRALVFGASYIFVLLLYFNVFLGVYVIMKFNWLWGLIISIVPTVDAFILARRHREYELKKTNRYVYYLGFALSYTIMLCLLFLLSSGHVFRYQAWDFSSRGMEPTIIPGDKLMVDNWAFKITRPRGGDLVLLQLPPNGRYTIKRVIATGAGELEFRDNAIYFNGEKINENFYPFIHAKRSDVIPPGVEIEPALGSTFRMKESEIFILGDNYWNSRDSRYFGPILSGSIIGKPLYIYDSPEDGRAGRYF